MNNINEMLDILALSEAKGKIYLEDIMEKWKIYLEDIMEKFSCSKRTAYRRIEEIMQVLPVEKDDYNKSYKIISRGRYMTENSDVTVTFVIYSLLISQAQGDTKVMLQKAFNNLKNALNMKNI